MPRKLSNLYEPCHLGRNVIGECVTCGEVADPLHMPMRLHGWFCAACCPVCNGAASLGRSGATGAQHDYFDARGAVQTNAGARGGGFNFGATSAWITGRLQA
jgi:hypothetical protein